MTLRALASALLLIAAATPQQKYFRYERPLTAPLAQRPKCVVLDGQVFAHAERDLADVRLYQGESETPYAISTASTKYVPELIHLLNAGVREGHTVFDAEMPGTHYSDLDLNVRATNFIATVAVSGSPTGESGDRTRLGEFTIFDFSRERLGRSTVLHLPPSNFSQLHFVITGGVEPGEVIGLSAINGAQSKAQSLTVASTAEYVEKDHATVFKFKVPAHVPIDRVVFVPDAQPVQFSRQIAITVEDPAIQKDSTTFGTYSVVGGGNLLRIHSEHAGRRIDEENLAIQAPQVDGDGERNWIVQVENGDDAPIHFKQVSLEMNERQLCFDGAIGAAYSLFYGDLMLSAPRYDYVTLFALQDDFQRVSLGPERPNALYTKRPDSRPFTERHPSLLWLALLAVILLLGLIALHTVKRQDSPRT